MQHHLQKTIRSFLVFLGLLLLGACATGPQPPALEYNPNYDFSAVKTIGFHSKSGTVVGDNPLQLSDMQRSQINQVIADTFKSQGYAVEDPEQPADLLASWHLITQHQTDIRSYQTGFGLGYGYGGYWGYYGRYGPYYPYTPYGGTEVVSRNYTQGKIILDMIDPVTGLSVWRGLSTVKIKDDPATDQANYNAIATAIVNAFPPKNL